MLEQSPVSSPPGCSTALITQILEPASSHMAARSLLWLWLGHQSFSDVIAMHLIWGCLAALKRKLFEGGYLHMGASANRAVSSVLGQRLTSVINFMLQTRAVSSLTMSSASLCSLSLQGFFFYFFGLWFIENIMSFFFLLLPHIPLMLHTISCHLSVSNPHQPVHS